MKLKSVTGVGHRPTTVYFIDVEGEQIEVKKMYMKKSWGVYQTEVYGCLMKKNEDF